MNNTKETQKAMEQTKEVKMEKMKKVGVGVALVAVAAATIIGSFTELPTPSYEKPLEAQVEAINEQNEDMYWATFDEKTEAVYKAGAFIGTGDLGDAKDVSYEVTKVETVDAKSDDVKEFLKYVELGNLKVEEAKAMELDVTYTDDAGKEQTKKSVPYAAIKIDGEWYAAAPLAALI